MLAGALAALVSAGLTAMVRSYALRRAILDVPTTRSSHTVPTPRGGGLAVVVTVVAGVAVLAATRRIPAPTAVALLCGVPVALVGWVDDRRGVSPRARLLVQAASAVAAVWALGGLPAFRAGPFGAVALGSAGAALATLGVVWLTNLYNFMDGIDGLAGGQAVVVAAAGGALAWSTGAPHIAMPAWLLAAAAAGFLAWNWAPARIFMGDVGSGFVGFSFAVLALASERQGGPSAALWVLLLGAFVFDASVTLARRAWYGESVTTPHRAHAYQRATQSGASHAAVTTACLAITGSLAVLGWLGTTRPTLAPAAAAAGLVVLAGAYAAVERVRPMRHTSGSAS